MSNTLPHPQEDMFLAHAVQLAAQLKLRCGHIANFTASSSFMANDIEPTELEGQAIKLASWNDFDIYLFLDNIEGRTINPNGEHNKFWLGFYSPNSASMDNLFTRLPESLRPLKTFAPNYHKRLIPIEMLVGRLYEIYAKPAPAEYYFGVWDYSKVTNPNFERGLDFITEVIQHTTNL